MTLPLLASNVPAYRTGVLRQLTIRETLRVVDMSDDQVVAVEPSDEWDLVSWKDAAVTALAHVSQDVCARGIGRAAVLLMRPLCLLSPLSRRVSRFLIYCSTRA